jgi:hypothetical protein
MAYTTINKGSSYFNTVLYTGTGSAISVTGVGFKPDWVWQKARSVAYEHNLYDIVRGTATLVSNLTNAENPNGASDFSTYNADGFTLNQSANYELSNNGTTYVTWNWLGANTTVSNTSGTITSTVSANTTSGFSIVSYTGNGSSSATVGHGLGVAPKMIILKRRNASDAWYVMHKSLTSNNNVFLNLTDAQQNVSTYTAGLISTSPTSSVFSFVNGSTVNNVNASGGTYIAYCFTDIKGYSKFGSYTGNGNADGPFIYTGFRPSFIMYKNSSNTGSWGMLDTVRSPYNPSFPLINANSANAEAAVTTFIDALSNGFKYRTSGSDFNATGNTYIYMAFAENPFVTSGGIPVTAR